jgi:hypothetical protein
MNLSANLAAALALNLTVNGGLFQHRQIGLLSRPFHRVLLLAVTLTGAFPPIVF